MPETQAFRVPPGILQKIVETKEMEVGALLSRESEFRSRALDAPPPLNLTAALRKGGEVAVMAEVKRRSPGAGPIRPDMDPAAVAGAYQEAGAAAVSVLTDTDYFGGALEDLEAVRNSVSIPVFRKEFIIHTVQLAEARAAGADGTLLIARILSDDALASLLGEALELGLTPLVEVHDQEELERALSVDADLIGINNRNLRTFSTSLDTTLGLLGQIPPGKTVVSESGIRTPEEVDRLGSAGVHGVLVGETLLRNPDPGGAARALVGRKRTEGSASGTTSR